jgi:hypothetical protein
MNSPLLNLRTIQTEQELRLRRLEEKSEIAEFMRRNGMAQDPKPGVMQRLGMRGGFLQRGLARFGRPAERGANSVGEFMTSTEP